LTRAGCSRSGRRAARGDSIAWAPACLSELDLSVVKEGLVDLGAREAPVAAEARTLGRRRRVGVKPSGLREARAGGEGFQTTLDF
jgi:hypothetical protein